MGCNCKWTEIIIAIVVFVTVMWPSILGLAASKWVAAIAAVILFLHAMMCKNCGACKTDGKMMSAPAVKRKRR